MTVLVVLVLIALAGGVWLTAGEEIAAQWKELSARDEQRRIRLIEMRAQAEIDRLTHEALAAMVSEAQQVRWKGVADAGLDS